MFTIVEEGIVVYKKTMMEYLIRDAAEKKEWTETSRDPHIYRPPMKDIGWKSRTETLLEGMEKALGLKPEEINKLHEEVQKLLSPS